MTSVSEDDASVHAANESGKTPVVFVHGLWLLASSWARWAEAFERAGFTALMPGWPHDPATVAEANANPEVVAGSSIRQVADHVASVIRRLDTRPVVVGHSFGGLLTEILAGRGLAAASVAISPAPFRGVLRLPFSSLRAASPVLRNPANRRRAVPLTYGQFRYAFANALDEQQARRLYDEFCVPAPGRPIFQAAAANLDPWTEARVDTARPDRGPMLVIGGGRDHTVPVSLSRSSFRQQRRNRSVTEFVELGDRGHSLVIDDGWAEVADTALRFASRFLS